VQLLEFLTFLRELLLFLAGKLSLVSKALFGRGRRPGRSWDRCDGCQQDAIEKHQANFHGI
jgi:hypothetical protein